MDTEKCRVLLTVLHERSLSAAAEALGYTPSGVSRLVDSLERETGFPLLHRGRGGVSATRACQELLPLMRRMAELDEQYQQLAHRIQGLDVAGWWPAPITPPSPVAVGGHCRVPSRLSRHPGGAAGGSSTQLGSWWITGGRTSPYQPGRRHSGCR
ncbi:MAG: LysR family transcriptional regulator [Oscillospiraceae bacterium]